jgi:hypothetical protein
MFSSQQCGSSVDLPVEVLLDNVFPYLDRSSFNALAMTSQQLHMASRILFVACVASPFLPPIQGLRVDARMAAFGSGISVVENFILKGMGIGQEKV